MRFPLSESNHSPVYLHCLETRVPGNRHEQAFITDRMQDWLADPRQRRVYRMLSRKSGIETRYSVLPDFTESPLPGLFSVEPNGRVFEPGTAARNAHYAREAERLSLELGRDILGKSAFDRSSITHVVTVSCTGFHNPGTDFQLVDGLGLSPATERYHLGFMGCYAAFPALRMARQFCQADPAAVVLVLCVELCTLHLQFSGDPDSLLANVLFSDGLGAALVSARSPEPGQAALRLDRFHSALVPEGRKEMAWDIGDRGFNLVLSSYVPEVISLNIRERVAELLPPGTNGPEDLEHWAVHPGGKAILDKVEAALGLQPDQLACSRRILRDYGNMSSSTILFVLKDWLHNSQPGDRAGAMAFGPGLVIETALLTRHPD